jgi:hypothetical protein
MIEHFIKSILKILSGHLTTVSPALTQCCTLCQANLLTGYLPQQLSVDFARFQVHPATLKER